jgi:hypothetical protein
VISRRFLAFAIILTVASLNVTPALAGQFLVDFAGDGPNSSGIAPGWDAVNNLVQDEPFGPLTDLLGSDNDVTLTALDDGFNPNNTAPPNSDATYDGILVPQEARNDYLFKITDQAGTTARIKIENLDAGLYNVTVFEGRTSDASQFAKLWVGDASGSGEPANENTGSFAGGSSTVSLAVGDGEVLWYQHLEDGSGGLSGFIINPVPEPTTISLLVLGATIACMIRRRR